MVFVVSYVITSISILALAWRASGDAAEDGGEAGNISILALAWRASAFLYKINLSD